MSPGTAGTAAVSASAADTCGATRTDKAWLADELGAALVQLSMVLRRAILPPQIGLTQATTLLILRDEGPQRVTKLAEAAQVTQPTMSALVIGMERLGWVRRDASSADRRAVAVCLTEGGGGVIRELEAARSRALQADLDALPAADLTALVAALPALRGIIAHEQQSKAVA
jgi:DNA-binding MarR family transcriptional regulator